LKPALRLAEEVWIAVQLFEDQGGPGRGPTGSIGFALNTVPGQSFFPVLPKWDDPPFFLLAISDQPGCLLRSRWAFRLSLLRMLSARHEG
jgi:hypothetical protein